ncbi:MAG: hypothetical protein HUJ54_05950 [Erysipelotrichaceae bacterium]|nr:hypothetical protein [Erysipelotrichaceae bacterium]
MKIIFLTGMAVCFGFGVLEIFTGSADCSVWWLIGGAVFTVMYGAMKKKAGKRDSDSSSELTSRLDEEERRLLESGKPLKEAAGLDLLSNEEVWWYDEACQDYYQGKKGLMYVTSRRLKFDAEGFSFDHPIALTDIIPSANGFEACVNGKKMRFLSASTPLLLNVWEQKKHQKKKGQKK